MATGGLGGFFTVVVLVGGLGAAGAGTGVRGAGWGVGVAAGGAVGALDAGLTCALQSTPMMFPGGPYWQTYVGHEQALLTAQPSFVVDFQTSWVK